MDKKIVNWKTFFILLTACAIGSVLVIPYQAALVPEAAEMGAMLYFMALAQGLVIFSIASFFGLLFAKKTGFALPVLQGKNKLKELKKILAPSILWGVTGGILIIALDLLFRDITVDLINPETVIPVWTGFLASFYGGIAEEVLMRLFLMSMLVWIAMKIKIPRNPAVWIAIVISGVAFGLGHLPLTAQLTEITALIVLRAVLLNGTGAVIFSLLYWKRGIESAMIAHFSADIVLHVITPFIVSLFIN